MKSDLGVLFGLAVLTWLWWRLTGPVAPDLPPGYRLRQDPSGAWILEFAN